VQLARAVRRQHHERPPRGPDRAQLGDRDREVGEELEQERLELVVGAVDLVDQQHRLPLVLERLEQRAPQQELAPEQLPGLAAGLRRADRQELAPVVPVVDRVVEVDALVALQADQPRAGRRREGTRHLRLPHPRLALEQQRLIELRREVDSGAQTPVGEVALAGQGPDDVVRRTQRGYAAASSSARRHSTRARCRL
jgi:hypothetical protein